MKSLFDQTWPAGRPKRSPYKKFRGNDTIRCHVPTCTKGQCRRAGEGQFQDPVQNLAAAAVGFPLGQGVPC